MSLIAGRGCRWPPRRDSVSCPRAHRCRGGRDTHDGHENSPILVFFSNLLDHRLQELQRRLDRLEETFIYQRNIDQETYDRQRDKLREEMVLARVELHEATLGGCPSSC